MKKSTWKSRITKACKEAGTYEPHFDHVIRTLAEILEKRDEVMAEYEASGDGPIIKHVNQGGNENHVKNPAIVMWDDLNKSALAYWRDLGLTPAGLKKIRGEAGEGKRSALEDALNDMKRELITDERT